MDFKINLHASICLDGKIFFDPFGIGKELPRKAEIVFITHPHYDHLSLEDIAKVADENTVFVCTADAAEILRGAGRENIRIVRAGEKFEVRGVKGFAFPAYNIGKPFHPKANGWVGYLAEYGGERVAVTGDCDATDDLAAIKCDVLFLPVGGKYTMNAEEAAAAALKIAPKLAVPMHYGSVAGTKEDGKRFMKALNGGVPCRLPY